MWSVTGFRQSPKYIIYTFGQRSIWNPITKPQPLYIVARCSWRLVWFPCPNWRSQGSNPWLDDWVWSMFDVPLFFPTVSVGMSWRLINVSCFWNGGVFFCFLTVNQNFIEFLGSPPTFCKRNISYIFIKCLLTAWKHFFRFPFRVRIFRESDPFGEDRKMDVPCTSSRTRVTPDIPCLLLGCTVGS